MQVTDKIIATSTIFSAPKDEVILQTPDNQYIRLDREEYIEAMKRIDPASFILDYEETEENPSQTEKEVIMTTQTQSIPVIDSTNSLCSHQFHNRYAIYCHDPFEYQPISNELIEQLAKDLKAEGAVILDTVMSSGRIGKYLTADSFDTIQHLINEKESDKDYLAEGYGAYLLDISHPLFYKGYPKLFWKDYQFDDRVSAEDFWGEVIYTNPTPFERSTR